MSSESFDEIFRTVSNWGRWGERDDRGTLNYLTPARIREAASLVRSGRSVSLALPLDTQASADNPRPATHYMVQGCDIVPDFGEPQFAMDYVASEIHGDRQTHLDALCHAAYKGRLYNNRSASSVSSRGPTLLDITNYANGIVGRGVLLDIPRLRGVDWLELGDAVMPAELEEAEKAQGVQLEEGDFLLFHTGRHRRRQELGPWNNGYDGEGRAGLHPAAMLLLHERRIAAFLPDADGETIPSNVEGVACPIHTLQIVAMGMPCADNLHFEELLKVCEGENRWTFMVVIAPLRVPQGTGSLINPIAIF